MVRRLFLLPLFFCIAHGDGDDDHSKLLYLSDNNFEHDTQAATGQTTGIWVVLFTNDGAWDHPELVLKALLSKTRDGVPLFAKVDVDKSPKTAKRFSVTKTPVVKMFRDGRMFTYPGDWSQQSIEAFIQEEWTQTVAEVVPKEAGFLDSKLVMNVLKLVALGVGVATCIWLMSNQNDKIKKLKT